jgi:predicted membrane protein
MEIIDSENKNAATNSNEDNWMRNWERSQRRGKIFGGMIVVAIGSLFLAREMGVEMPYWLFSWKVLLIVIGFFVGVKHSFRGGGWLVPIIIGSAFLLKDNFPDLAISHYIWPIAIILFGLMIMFKPRRKGCRDHRAYRKWGRHQGWQQRGEQYAQWQQKKNSDNYLELNAVFGGIEKNIITKDFKGGEINVVFGGAEVNMSQADFNERIELEINNVFAGTKLIVPAHWEIRSEITAVLGSVEDKRSVLKDMNTDKGKILVLKGNVVFGGIDIQSF